MLDDVVLASTPRANERAGVSFDHRRARNRQRSFRRTPELELEQTLTSLRELGARSLRGPTYAARSRLSCHGFGEGNSAVFAEHLLQASIELVGAAPQP